MSESIVRLAVPAQPSYARTVRMLVANLAVLCNMTIDEVEDVRVIAGEAFAYVCATSPEVCEMTFIVKEDGLDMSFSLGEVVPEDDEEAQEWVELTKLLLVATSDSFEVAEAVMRVSKRAGVANDV